MTAMRTIGGVLGLAGTMCFVGFGAAAAQGAPGAAEPDVRFLQGMIEHHAQALEMARLVPSRASSADIRMLALRIELSQLDEIRLMHGWLAARGEWSPAVGIIAAAEAGQSADPRGEAPATGAHGGHAEHMASPPPTGDAHGAHAEHAGHGGAVHGAMHSEHMAHQDGMDHAAHGAAAPHPHHGMLTPEEMGQLAAASGPEFDRLFLHFMIRHHEGALVMVDELFASATGGQDAELFELATHVDSDQRVELDRMRSMAASLR